MENINIPDLEILEKVLEATDSGWWKLDTTEKSFTLSRSICRLFNLESEKFSFEQFKSILDKTYIKSADYELTELIINQANENILPLLLEGKTVWCRTKVLGQNCGEEKGKTIWGSLQIINKDVENNYILSQKINSLIRTQKEITHQLLGDIESENYTLMLEKILQDTLKQLKVDRIFVFEFDMEKQEESCTFEYVSQRAKSDIENLQHLKLSEMAWYTDRIVNYRSLVLNSIDELPEEAVVDREIFQRKGITSVIALPMLSLKEVSGFIGVEMVGEERVWTIDNYLWLSSIANIISICVELRNTKRDERNRNKYINNLVNAMSIGHLRLKSIYNKEEARYEYVIKDINHAAEMILDTPAKELLNKRKTALDCELCKSLNMLLDSLNKDCRHTESQLYISKTGKYCTATAFSLSNGETTILLKDNTDLIKALNLAEDNEEKLSIIFDNIPVGIAMFDKAGQMFDTNKQCIEIFGIARKEDFYKYNINNDANIPADIKENMIHKVPSSVSFKYDFSTVGRAFESRVKSGIKHLSIRTTPLYDNYGKFTASLCVIIDETDAVANAFRIEEFEQIFSRIAKSSGVGVAKYNLTTQKGYASEQWYKNLEEDPHTEMKEILHSFSNLYIEDKAKIENFIEVALQGKADSLKSELRVLQPDGNTKWISSDIQITRNPVTNEMEYHGMNFDITESKDINAKLTEALNAASASQKFQKAFVENICHEIRTPLNVILGFSTLITQSDDKEEKQKYSAIVEENTEILLQIINDILDISEIDSGNIELFNEYFDVASLCKDVYMDNIQKIKPELKFESNFPEKTVLIFSDKDRISQLLNILISNADKFTHKGSIIMGYRIKYGEVEFYVRDSGIGISEDDQQKIFERFTKLDDFTNGVGLGLSIAKSITKALGGKIGLYSEPDNGSMFWFTIPLK